MNLDLSDPHVKKTLTCQPRNRLQQVRTVYLACLGLTAPSMGLAWSKHHSVNVYVCAFHWMWIYESRGLGAPSGKGLGTFLIGLEGENVEFAPTRDGLISSLDVLEEGHICWVGTEFLISIQSQAFWKWNLFATSSEGIDLWSWVTQPPGAPLQLAQKDSSAPSLGCFSLGQMVSVCTTNAYWIRLKGDGSNWALNSSWNMAGWKKKNAMGHIKENVSSMPLTTPVGFLYYQWSSMTHSSFPFPALL